MLQQNIKISKPTWNQQGFNGACLVFHDDHHSLSFTEQILNK